MILGNAILPWIAIPVAEDDASQEKVA